MFESSTDGTNYTFLGEATGSRAVSGKSDESKMLLAPSATTFTLTGLNLMTGQNLFILARGFDASGSETTASARNAVLVAPTAATVSISGRVVTPQEFGLTNARVTLTDSQGVSRTISTGKFGSFRFTDLTAGETYVLSASSRRYTYAPQVITPTEAVTGVIINPIGARQIIEGRR